MDDHEFLWFFCFRFIRSMYQYRHGADYVRGAHFNMGNDSSQRDYPSFCIMDIITGFPGTWCPEVISVLPFCSFLQAIIHQQVFKNAWTVWSPFSISILYMSQLSHKMKCTHMDNFGSNMSSILSQKEALCWKGFLRKCAFNIFQQMVLLTDGSSPSSPKEDHLFETLSVMSI